MDAHPKRRMPLLVIAGFAMFIMAALSALLTHPHNFRTFYAALGFLAVVFSVWLWKRLSPNAY
jgi:hypothetical protein